MEPLIGADAGQSAPLDLIKESSTASFAQDVIEASMHDARSSLTSGHPGAAPASSSTPILEKTVVAAARGVVRLVKVNIDENQDLADAAPGAVGARPSTPSHQGRPVDGFQGALPESQVKRLRRSPGPAMAGAELGPEPHRPGPGTGRGGAGKRPGMARPRRSTGRSCSTSRRTAKALAGHAALHAMAAGDQAGARETIDALDRGDCARTPPSPRSSPQLELAEASPEAPAPSPELDRAKVAARPRPIITSRASTWRIALQGAANKP